ncbi:SDR family NAD(P)-dependent oxidoreductase [Solibacillus sp. R5-41]|uniref:SDR family NAD(P)-dependent oxidoreductase n=1 Tax=Solibacillus sp. R5-41 TaxID=2048654 RepID=UPI0020A2D9A2|nr:SDR family NAD(P)-dependent oxidoreductase [Solibacillus sp. R5-41]
MDVRNELAVESAFKRIIEEKNRVDVVVNNAGLQHRDKVEDFPLEKWNLLLDVMLTGSFLMTKHAFPYMKKANFGRIINISSIHGLMASPEKAAYVAAKHGVIGLTDVTGIEGAPFGITVNAVCPGAVKTDLLVKQLDDLNKQEGLSEQEALSKIVSSDEPIY